MRASKTEAEARPGALKSLRDIPKAIRDGQVAPVYLFFGTDDYLLEELVHESLEALLPKGSLRDFNVDVLDGVIVPVDEITTIAGTYPMGASRRVVIVRNPGFLASGGQSPAPLELLRLASEASESGNAARALTLLFRALELEPVPLNAPDARARLAAFRGTVSDGAPELLAFLDGAPETFADAPLPDSISGGNDGERFRDWLERHAPPTTAVLLVLNSPLGRQTKLVRSIAERGVLADVDSLKDATANGRDPVALFIGKRLKDAKRRMDEDAARLFRERTRDDLRLIVDECEKLFAYVGDRETIDADDVRAAVSDGSELSVFDLTDAVGNRQLARAFQCLQSVLRSGEPALKTLALVIRQVRLMLQAHLLREAGYLLTFAPNMPYKTFTNTIYGKWAKEVVALLPDSAQLNLLKQKPYPAYLTLKQAANYSRRELLRAHETLLRADEDLKSSVSADEFVLYRAIEEIVVGERRRKTPPAADTAIGR